VTPAPKTGPHETAAVPSPAAERMRRHRQRRKNRLRSLTLEIRESEIDALSRKGYLHPDSPNDPDAIVARKSELDRVLSKLEAVVGE